MHQSDNDARGNEICSYVKVDSSFYVLGDRWAYIQREIRNYNESTGSSSLSSKARESFEVPNYQSSGTVPEQFCVQHTASHQLDFDTFHTAQGVIN